MKLISNNLICGNYLSEIIDDPDWVIRVNLAWYDKEKLNYVLEWWNFTYNEVMLDVPIGRKKPPNNNYTKEELAHIIADCDCVKYVAISNVEEPSDLDG